MSDPGYPDALFLRFLRSFERDTARSGWDQPNELYTVHYQAHRKAAALCTMRLPTEEIRPLLAQQGVTNESQFMTHMAAVAQEIMKDTGGPEHFAGMLHVSEAWNLVGTAENFQHHRVTRTFHLHPDATEERLLIMTTVPGRTYLVRRVRGKGGQADAVTAHRVDGARNTLQEVDGIAELQGPMVRALRKITTAFDTRRNPLVR